MTKIYETTKQIHKTIILVNRKYGLNIDIKSDNDFVIYATSDSNQEWQSEINEKEIKIILNALKDYLGDNTEHAEMDYGIKNLYKDGGYSKYTAKVEDVAKKYTPDTLAGSFCHKWLDGLNPMFESEPEKVLEELLEVLKNFGLLEVLNNLIKN
jgi:hypothetical protein